MKSGESLIKDEYALDYEYLPKLLPYREDEQRRIAECIKPLLAKRSGRNLLIYGAPGIGKTAAVRFVLRDLENETDEVAPIYINCWKKNTSFKIALDICDQLGYKFTQNKSTDDLFEIISGMINKRGSAVFALDEIDKLEDSDFLYFILEEIYRKTIIMITNLKSWIVNLDERIRSRLMTETIEFRQYNDRETKGILAQRLKYAFVDGVWDNSAFTAIAEKTAQIKDIRTGLYLMKEAALSAESRASKKITLDDANAAIAKLDSFSVKNSAELEDDEREILHFIKEHNDMKIGELYKLYQEAGGVISYKTFQRKLAKLEEGKFITLTKTEGGIEGNTSIVHFAGITKKLTEF